MSWKYPLHNNVDLYVSGRVAEKDSRRQEATAKAILDRLEGKPGVILADEVGMGKTFVAFAVAASVVLTKSKTTGPVVVMCPPSVMDKWYRDADVFREYCLKQDGQKRFTVKKAEYPVPFLKLLDDPPEKQCGMILVPHGIFNRRVRDVYTRYALIRQALLWNRDDGLTRAVSRFAPRILRCENLGIPEHLWMKLLKTAPVRWRSVLESEGFEYDDDPVPRQVVEALHKIDMSSLKTVLGNIPRRRSSTLDKRLQDIRRAISNELLEVWGSCLVDMDFKLPLLVMDEAHHLRNSGTRLAGLFQEEKEDTPSGRFAQGALNNVFERMLFLTATPFQLGHNELCNVLERFGSVRMSGSRAPQVARDEHIHTIQNLRRRLDTARIAAVALEAAWAKLDKKLIPKNESLDSDWVAHFQQLSEEYTPAHEVLRRFHEAKHTLHKAEEVLQPWVIRHIRSRWIVENEIPRRRRFSGSVLEPEPCGKKDLLTQGLQVSDQAVLPFLLANRLASLKNSRAPVFADGLASSYEAFLDTRSDDSKEDGENISMQDGQISWYLTHIEKAVRSQESLTAMAHPKIGPVVDLALALWEKGEKVLIFCHYIETGKALRRHISRRIHEWIQARGCEQLDCSPDELNKYLENISTHFNPDRPVRRALSGLVGNIVSKYEKLSEIPSYKECIEDIIARFLRTPTFLLRYMDISGKLNAEWIEKAFSMTDSSKLQLSDIIDNFCAYLGERCGDEERNEYLQALDSIQVGMHTETRGFSDDELTGDTREKLVANVRLVNGASKYETRRKVMLAFNTPFYPEILIGSSVMAESVDLQLACRHVIHHDLDWNPSVLEQRTGRVDRIGAKAEIAKQPIHVYFPYIAGTQDEKKFRVVMDRERWFGITMGGIRKVPEPLEAEDIADRVPLPDAAIEALTLKLNVWPENNNT